VSLIPRTRGGALLRFALAAVIVIAFAASATAVAGLLQFKQIAAEISATPAIKHAEVTIANPGNPQTLLLIGSDHRAGTSWKTANTDTMMLVRMDPNSSTINLLSIPRDLKVLIPQGGARGFGKLNSAYSIGGPNLLVKILSSQVFPGLQINHIIDVNFGGFEALVNAIGCVYTDVDHRYYNNTAFTNYSSIDLQPGYEKLCGANALAFVRFRHTDSDIVRNARQQDFLRWVKQQFSEGSLISQRDKLISIFGQHTETDADLHSVDGLINLFNLVAFSAAHAVKQVSFPAMILPCNVAAVGPNGTPCYVGADPGALHRAFASFMAVTPPPAAPPSGSGPGPGPGRPGEHHGPPPPVPVYGDFGDGKAQAGALGNMSFPVYVPKVIANGSRYCTAGTCPMPPTTNSYPRAYLIHDQRGGAHYAYRMTLVLNPALGQYYGVQGMTWQNPPLLNSPTQTKVVNGKRLLLYINGGKINVAAWRTPQGVYWISNDLTNDLSNAQMVAIAASLTPASGGGH
jgi:polyisoprenyl-teichoic acid--peptidoglycan teichoic acid transferase